MALNVSHQYNVNMRKAVTNIENARKLILKDSKTFTADQGAILVAIFNAVTDVIDGMHELVSANDD
jgi:hypothetical protein